MSLYEQGKWAEPATLLDVNPVTERKKGIHFFTPRKMLAKWRKTIPRKDLRLESHHSICQKHFLEEDIIKEKKWTGKDGPIIYPLLKWTLVNGSVPKLLLGNLLYVLL